jgi:putative transposase
MGRETVFIHIVFSTKYRQRVLTDEIINSISHYLKEQSVSKPFDLEELNGFENHIHCLISCHASISLPDIVKWLKGSSSRWMNQQTYLNHHFKWGVGYYAARVHSTEFDNVVRYIQNQRINHLKRMEKNELGDKALGLKSGAAGGKGVGF